MKRIIILGAGGHAQVVADVLLRAYEAGERIIPIGYLDDDPALQGGIVLGLPVFGGIDMLSQLAHDAIVVAVGNNRSRAKLAGRLQRDGERFAVAQHPSAVVAPDVQIGPGAMICAGAVVNTGSAIGAHVILNTSCSVDHHNRIDDHAHIAPGVHIGGEVIVEAGALIGIGATVMPRCLVGAWATVGAGAVVTESVPPGVTVVGVPAKPLQKG